jgi:hypothetical protein
MSVYRKPAPYRKPQTYRGEETALPVVPPNINGTTSLPWLDADDHFAATQFDWQQAQASNAPIQAPWRTSHPFMHLLAHAWQQANPNGYDTATPWGKAEAFSALLSAPWMQANPFDTHTAMPWRQFRQQLATQLGLPWITPDTHAASTRRCRGPRLPRTPPASRCCGGAWLSSARTSRCPGALAATTRPATRTPFVNPPDDGSTPSSSPTFRCTS